MAASVNHAAVPPDGDADDAAASDSASSDTAQSGSHARMDREFISEHHIIERYLSGRLPLKGAQDFERFCRQHPELLEEISLSEHLHAALRLLEAAGHAPPWEERPKSWWEKLPVLLGTAAIAAILATTSLIGAGKLAAQKHKAALLEQRLAAQPLDPPASTRPITLEPSRTAPSRRSLATIGGAGESELADLKIDVSWSKFATFRITIDRIDQGRVAVLHNMLRDSNGDLRLALNSSALGPGDYQLAIDGVTWSGQPVAQAWATISVAH